MHSAAASPAMYWAAGMGDFVVAPKDPPEQPAARLPLAGLRVLVTRPADQAADMLARLAALGAQAVVCPTIQIVPPASFAPLDAAIRQIETYDWVIFTSVNGVRFFFERLNAAGSPISRLGGCRLAAIGPATAGALAEHGLKVDLMPQKYVAEAILAEIGDVAGRHILLPRADIARKALAEGLAAAGAQVAEVVAYRTVSAGAALPAGPLDVATFTSPSTLRSFVALIEASGETPATYLAGALVACIGPITARAAAEEGLSVDLVAAEHTVDGLLAAVIKHLHGDRRR